jgi:hypothetical protein
VRAQIDLLYQGTSWEYIQFLYKANNGVDPAQGGNAFLGEEGTNHAYPVRTGYIIRELMLSLQLSSRVA